MKKSIVVSLDEARQKRLDALQRSFLAHPSSQAAMRRQAAAGRPTAPSAGLPAVRGVR